MSYQRHSITREVYTVLQQSNSTNIDVHYQLIFMTISQVSTYDPPLNKIVITSACGKRTFAPYLNTKQYHILILCGQKKTSGQSNLTKRLHRCRTWTVDHILYNGLTLSPLKDDVRRFFGCYSKLLVVCL